VRRTAGYRRQYRLCPTEESKTSCDASWHRSISCPASQWTRQATNGLKQQKHLPAL
jgi:hypothetical protein